MKDDELYFWNGPLPETQAPATTPEPWAETKVVGKPVVLRDFQRMVNTRRKSMLT